MEIGLVITSYKVQDEISRDVDSGTRILYDGRLSNGFTSKETEAVESHERFELKTVQKSSRDHLSIFPKKSWQFTDTKEKEAV